MSTTRTFPYTDNIQYIDDEKKYPSIILISQYCVYYKHTREKEITKLRAFIHNFHRKLKKYKNFKNDSFLYKAFKDYYFKNIDRYVSVYIDDKEVIGHIRNYIIAKLRASFLSEIVSRDKKRNLKKIENKIKYEKWKQSQKI